MAEFPALIKAKYATLATHISGSSLSAQARYAAGTREILECWFENRPIREEIPDRAGRQAGRRGRARLQAGRRDSRIRAGGPLQDVSHRPTGRHSRSCRHATGRGNPLQLEQLKQPGRLAGGRHHPQITARIGEQQTGGGDVQQLRAPVGHHVQEVDHVESGDHGVGQLDERLRQQISVHPAHPYDQGRCLDCFRSGRPVAAADLAAGVRRWPRFDAAAREAGFAAVQALPMRLRDQVIGALNLFRATPGAFNPADVRVGQALADVATISLLHERNLRHSDTLNEQLQVALNSRVLIEQTKGKLAERFGLDMAQAFSPLRDRARSRNLPCVRPRAGIHRRDRNPHRTDHDQAEAATTRRAGTPPAAARPAEQAVGRPVALFARPPSHLPTRLVAGYPGRWPVTAGQARALSDCDPGSSRPCAYLAMLVLPRAGIGWMAALPGPAGDLALARTTRPRSCGGE